MRLIRTTLSIRRPWFSTFWQLAKLGRAGFLFTCFFICTQTTFAQSYMGTCTEFSAVDNCNTLDNVSVDGAGDIAAAWSVGGVANSSILIESVWVQTNGVGSYVSQTIPAGTECIGGIGSRQVGDAGTWILAGSYSSSDNIIIYYESWTSPNCGGTCCGFSSVTSGTILPINMISFEAIQLINGVEVNWTTVSEEESDLFVLERSSDGVQYSPIGTMKAAGNSRSPIDYALQDDDPMIGINYYRLVQYDFDGRSSFSQTIVVEYQSTTSFDFNMVNYSKALEVISPYENAILQIFSLQGILLLNSNLEKNFQSIDLSSLPSGSYYISMRSSTAQQSERIMIL